MCEVNCHIVSDGESFELKMPVGPYRNPMCLPFHEDYVRDATDVYLGIFTELERYGPGAPQFSLSHEFLWNDANRRYIREWSLNGSYNTYRPNQGTLFHGQVFPYIIGRWFPDLLDEGAQFGGKRKTRKAHKGGRASTQDSFLADPIFRTNVQRNLVSRKNTKRTQVNRHTPVKERGHASANVQPMSLDTYTTLVSMFKDPMYAKILNLYFKRTSENIKQN